MQKPRQQIGFVTAYPLPDELFDGVLNQLFDGPDLIKFVDKLRLKLEADVICFSYESMPSWAKAE